MSTINGCPACAARVDLVRPDRHLDRIGNDGDYCCRICGQRWYYCCQHDGAGGLEGLYETEEKTA